MILFFSQEYVVANVKIAADLFFYKTEMILEENPFSSRFQTAGHPMSAVVGTTLSRDEVILCVGKLSGMKIL